MLIPKITSTGLETTSLSSGLIIKISAFEFDKDLDNPPVEFTSLYGNKREHRNNVNIKIEIYSYQMIYLVVHPSSQQLHHILNHQMLP